MDLDSEIEKEWKNWNSCINKSMYSYVLVCLFWYMCIWKKNIINNLILLLIRIFAERWNVSDGSDRSRLVKIFRRSVASGRYFGSCLIIVRINWKTNRFKKWPGKKTNLHNQLNLQPSVYPIAVHSKWSDLENSVVSSALFRLWWTIHFVFHWKMVDGTFQKR